MNPKSKPNIKNYMIYGNLLKEKENSNIPSHGILNPKFTKIKRITNKKKAKNINDKDKLNEIIHKDNNSHSRVNKKSVKNNKFYLNDKNQHPYIGNLQKKNINKTICHEHLVLTKHDRNLSAPSLEYKNKANRPEINDKKSKGKKNKRQKNNVLEIYKISDENNNDFSDELEIRSVKNSNTYLLTNYEKLTSNISTFNNNSKTIHKETNDDFILNDNTTPDDEYDSIIKVKLTNFNQSKEAEEDDTIKNYIQNNNNIMKKNNNKKDIKPEDRKLNKSNYKKNIQTIKSKIENIAFLKEQLRNDKKNRTKNMIKTKLNNTMNTSINTTANYNKNKHKFSNRINYNIINNDNYILSNFHNYNQNALSKNNINYNNNHNIQIYSKDLTPNKKVNNTNRTGNNLTYSSNNKTMSVSTSTINNTNNTNDFGKKLNLTQIYGHQHDKGKGKKDKSHNKLKNYSTIGSDRTKEFNNKYKKSKLISLQKPQFSKGNNSMCKSSNIFSLRHQYNNFQTQKGNQIKKQKKLNDENNLLTQNSANKSIDNISSGYRYNSIVNEKNPNNKVNVSYDVSHKTVKDLSKMKIIPKRMDLNLSKKDEKSLKKRNSCKPTLSKEKNKPLDESIDEKNHTRVKKFLTKCEFKFKSIFKVGIICKAGEVIFGEIKTNQDNYFDSLLNDDLRFIGVCDGHGENGHYVSDYLRKNLPIELDKELKSLYESEGAKIKMIQKELVDNEESNNSISKSNGVLEKMKKAFITSFHRTDEKLSDYCRSIPDDDKNKFNVEYSGSTCVSVLMKEKNINKMYIGNVGDSRVIVIKETPNKYWTCQQLSRDHKPTEKDEAARIFEADGEIEKIEDDEGNWTGPLRVWVKGSDGPGLAMTRSLGDEVGTSVGVVCTPEVTEYKIKDEDRALIIASDGLWEYMTNKEVTNVFKKFIGKKDPDKIVNELYKESVIRWKIKDQGIDDITIICVLFK